MLMRDLAHNPPTPASGQPTAAEGSALIDPMVTDGPLALTHPVPVRLFYSQHVTNRNSRKLLQTQPFQISTRNTFPKSDTRSLFTTPLQSIGTHSKQNSVQLARNQQLHENQSAQNAAPTGGRAALVSFASSTSCASFTSSNTSAPVRARDRDCRAGEVRAGGKSGGLG